MSTTGDAILRRSIPHLLGWLPPWRGGEPHPASRQAAALTYPFSPATSTPGATPPSASYDTEMYGAPRNGPRPAPDSGSASLCRRPSLLDHYRDSLVALNRVGEIQREEGGLDMRGCHVIAPVQLIEADAEPAGVQRLAFPCLRTPAARAARSAALTCSRTIPTLWRGVR